MDELVEAASEPLNMGNITAIFIWIIGGIFTFLLGLLVLATRPTKTNILIGIVFVGIGVIMFIMAISLALAP